VLQRYSPFAQISVAQDIAFGVEMQGIRGFFRGWGGAVLAAAK
jgi:ABC-type sulfate/molybdate transport systems ATPase subunit